MHFVFIPGRDRAYEQSVKRTFEAMGLPNVSVLGYVSGMAELMEAADLAILKSGGLTVTECLCADLPMLLLGRSYGQEKANTVMLTSLGAALHVTTPRELVAALQRIDEHPEALKALLVNGEALKRPHAAEDIARATMERVGVPMERKKHLVEFYWGGKPAHTR